HGRAAPVDRPVAAQAAPRPASDAGARRGRPAAGRRRVGARSRRRAAAGRPRGGYGLHHVRARRRNRHRWHAGPRATLEGGGRPHDCDLHLPLPGGGVAMIGLVESDRHTRPEKALEEAINSPLIDVDITGATGALVNVTGGNDMSVSEAERVAEIVQGRIAPNDRIVWGAAVDPSV